jgi:ribulose kinase
MTENQTSQEALTEVEGINQVKEDVIKELCTSYSFEVNEADDKVAESMRKEPGMWSVKADAKDIADYLANDDDDE